MKKIKIKEIDMAAFHSFIQAAKISVSHYHTIQIFEDLMMINATDDNKAYVKSCSVPMDLMGKPDIGDYKEIKIPMADISKYIAAMSVFGKKKAELIMDVIPDHHDPEVGVCKKAVFKSGSLKASLTPVDMIHVQHIERNRIEIYKNPKDPVATFDLEKEDINALKALLDLVIKESDNGAKSIHVSLDEKEITLRDVRGAGDDQAGEFFTYPLTKNVKVSKPGIKFRLDAGFLSLSKGTLYSCSILAMDRAGALIMAEDENNLVATQMFKLN